MIQSDGSQRMRMFLVPTVASEPIEPRDVFRHKLHPQGGPQRTDAEPAQIEVEIVVMRRQCDCLDPDRARPVEQLRHRNIASRIGVADDV